ncbi:hypothetical protein ACTXOJ_03685 [Glutamicibacter arilaitensis]|uniref:hypothetical protein n=2 Tax=Glutamicibacter arilaitensis TaxID=256701 RepID=UPI003FD2B592
MTNPDFSRPATNSTKETMTNPDFTGKSTETTEAPTVTPAIEKAHPMNRYALTENSHTNPSTGSTYKLPQTLRSITRMLKNHNLDAPQELLNGLASTVIAAKQRVNALNPESNGQYLDNAAQAVLKGEDPQEHLLQHVIWSQTTVGLEQRVEALARANYLQALNSNADNITRQIGKKLFFPALADLASLLDKHPGKQWSLDAAVNAKDFTHAALIESNAHIANKLHDACQLRALLYTPEAFTDEAAYVTLPGFKGNFATDNLQWWVQILDQGHSLWFPTANEWHKATNGEEFSEYRKAEAEALAELNAEAETELGADKPAPYEPARSLAKSAY